MSRKKLLLGVLAVIVICIAVLPTAWFRPPPTCPICRGWATEVRYEDRDSATALCSRCDQEWFEYAKDVEPPRWWMLFTTVSKDSPAGIPLAPGK